MTAVAVDAGIYEKSGGKILLGHEHGETTDRYLRAIAVDACVLKRVLDTLLSGAQEP